MTQLLEVKGNYYFRGVSSSKFRLQSSLSRRVDQSSHPDHVGLIGSDFREQLLIEEFKKIAHNYLPSENLPTNLADWLSLMQHHGVPTRLLDVTRSPYIALYFAVRNWRETDDAVVWALSPVSLHKSLLHRLKGEGFDGPVDPYQYRIGNLPQLLEDKYFRGIFFSDRSDVAMLFNPTWANPRLAAQQGAFIITSNYIRAYEDVIVEQLQDKSFMDPRKAEMIERFGYDFSLRRFVIPGELKRQLCAELYKMNIHGGTLFPGIEGMAMGISEYGAL
jgi:hypothetical protein